jgi:uncharacterized protein
MKLLFDFGHPAHVHYFRNAIKILTNRGHEVRITARDKEMLKQLLDAYGLDYTITGTYRPNMLGKAVGMIKNDIALFRIAREYRPDLFISFGSPYAAHVSRLVGKKHVAFTDTEHAKFTIWLTFPFTDLICTPSCYTRSLPPRKHVKFNGYMELCYLHPKYFKPDPGVLRELGLVESETFFVVRFVSWEASHDIGQRGLSLDDKRSLVKELSAHGRVLITSESKLPDEFEPYRLTIPPEKIHNLLYYASMYIGEGATMASEAAILGTPSVYINSLSLGYLQEQEHEYGLTSNFHDSESALKKVRELVKIKNLKAEWKKKRERMLVDKIDVTAWMTDLIVSYGGS